MYVYTFNLYITSKYICVLLRLKTNVSYCNVKHDSVRSPIAYTTPPTLSSTPYRDHRGVDYPNSNWWIKKSLFVSKISRDILCPPKLTTYSVSSKDLCSLIHTCMTLNKKIQILWISASASLRHTPSDLHPKKVFLEFKIYPKNKSSYPI